MIQIQIKSLPHRHELEIKMTFENTQEQVDLFLPVWRPGRYEVANFAMNLSQLQAFDTDGKILPISQFQSNGWRIQLDNKKKWSVKYTYYANKMDAGNSMVNQDQVYINFVNCILHADAWMDEGIIVNLDLPKDYLVACSLNQTQRGQFSAANYHELVDSPLLASDQLKILRYETHGTLFNIAFMGAHPLEDSQILDDFQKFTQAQCDAMGGFPCPEYYFLVQSLDYKHYHGVEHQRSTVLVLGPNHAESKNEYREKLIGVASHELFHSWNVTRIRPAQMSPYIYKEEINFDTGFVAEGFTTYYGDYFLRTSVVFSDDDYLKELNTLCQRHFDNFGRFRISLIDSSRRLWLDGYKNNYPSNQVSIYVKGALASMILDLNIRKETQGRFSLIDVVKKMYERHTFSQGGYTWEDVKNIFFEIGGKKILLLAEELVESKQDIEPLLNAALHEVGCKLNKSPHPDQFMAQTGAKVMEGAVVDVAPGSWAEKNFSIGDQILTINERPFDAKSEIKKGFEIEIMRNSKPIIVRYDGEQYVQAFAYHINMMEGISNEQRAFRRDWLGENKKRV